MIEITSREKAIEVLGHELGPGAWEQFEAHNVPVYKPGLIGVKFIRPPKKLEPLTDEELYAVLRATGGGMPSALRAVVTAHDERMAEIRGQDDEWRPIAELPKDGKVLVYDANEEDKMDHSAVCQYTSVSRVITKHWTHFKIFTPPKGRK